MIRSDINTRRTNAEKMQAVRTILTDPKWSQQSNMEIARQCQVSEAMVRLRRGEIADSDHASLRHGCWSEAAMHCEFVTYLHSLGIRPKASVSCASGVADIVTDHAVYELERFLKRHTVFHAVGQVLLYRACINPKAKAVILGRCWKGCEDIYKAAEKAGVIVVLWDGAALRPIGETIATIESC